MAPTQQKSSAGLFQSLLRGALGFAGVSIAAFAVWSFAGVWVARHAGEGSLFLACAIIFIGLSGLLLHSLVRGPGSLVRFYKIFIPAFAAYAVAWSAAWFALGFGIGEWLGSLAGSVVLTLMIRHGLRSRRPVIKASVVMFILHSAGYFLGGRLMQWLMNSADGGPRANFVADFAKLSWGLLYGLGVGAGLGYAFFTFQNEPAPTAAIENMKHE